MTTVPPGRPPVGDRRRAAAAAVPALVVFGALLLLVHGRWGPLLGLDQHSTAALHRFAVAHRGFVLAMKAVSALGTSLVYFVLVGRLLLWLLPRRRYRAAGFAVVATAGGSALNGLAKGIIGRTRPVFADPVAHAGYSSFPSGHAQAVAVAVGVFLVLLLPAVPTGLRRRAVAAVLGWALLVAFSRVALVVHYPTDVLAGLALGSVWVLACATAFGPAPYTSRPPSDRCRGS